MRYPDDPYEFYMYLKCFILTCDLYQRLRNSRKPPAPSSTKRKTRKSKTTKVKRRKG